jgi:hypothetical protein
MKAVVAPVLSVVFATKTKKKLQKKTQKLITTVQRALSRLIPFHARTRTPATLRKRGEFWAGWIQARRPGRAGRSRGAGSGESGRSDLSDRDFFASFFLPWPARVVVGGVECVSESLFSLRPGSAERVITQQGVESV